MSTSIPHPDAQRAFEEMMPEPDGYAAMTPNGSIIVPPSRFREVNGYAIYTADQLRTAMQAAWDAAWNAALSQRPAAPASFDQYWTEDGRNLCKSPLDSVEARMHKRTWDVATERAAKVEREECAALCDQMSSSDYLPFQCATAIRNRAPCTCKPGLASEQSCERHAAQNRATAIRSSGRGEG